MTHLAFFAEYGILMPRHCQKFDLDREVDPHFFSGIDGSLFQPNQEKFYPNDEYCVDYFYYKDALDPEVDLIEARRSLRCCLSH